jgi:hypothetical protein
MTESKLEPLPDRISISFELSKPKLKRDFVYVIEFLRTGL